MSKETKVRQTVATEFKTVEEFERLFLPNLHKQRMEQRLKTDPARIGTGLTPHVLDTFRKHLARQ